MSPSHQKRMPSPPNCPKQRNKICCYSLFSINMIILKHPSYHFPLNQRRPLQCTKIEAHVTCREVSAHVACQAFIKCSWRDLLEGILTFFTSFLFSFLLLSLPLVKYSPPNINLVRLSKYPLWARLPSGRSSFLKKVISLTGCKKNCLWLWAKSTEDS